MKSQVSRKPRKRPPTTGLFVTGTKMLRVDSEVFADVIGGAPIGRVGARHGSPVSRAAVRQELTKLLKSTGGRPGLEGSVRRQKIPLSDDEWMRLELLSQLFAESGVKATAGQVARVLLRLVLERMTGDELVADTSR